MSYSSEVLADSPKAYYRMQEASGLIQDSSGMASPHAAGCPEQVCRVCGKARERVVVERVGAVKNEDFYREKASVVQQGGMASTTLHGTPASSVTLGFTDCDCQEEQWHTRAPNSNPSPPSTGGVASAGSSGTRTEGDSLSGRDSSPSASVDAFHFTMDGLSKYRPGIVLDPFIGSGTVAYVARKLGRHALGIDLSAEYLALAARRLQQQSLFAEVASGS